MQLYLDEDSLHGQVVQRLRDAGHDVDTAALAGLLGDTDPRQFVYAVENGLAFMTRNHDDFLELHDVVVATDGTHPGIIVVRHDNDPTRDMSARGIVTALKNLELSGVPLENGFHILNQWR